MFFLLMLRIKNVVFCVEVIEHFKQRVNTRFTGEQFH